MYENKMPPEKILVAITIGLMLIHNDFNKYKGKKSQNQIIRVRCPGDIIQIWGYGCGIYQHDLLSWLLIQYRCPDVLDAPAGHLYRGGTNFVRVNGNQIHMITGIKIPVRPSYAKLTDR